MTDSQETQVAFFLGLVFSRSAISLFKSSKNHRTLGVSPPEGAVGCLAVLRMDTRGHETHRPD